MYRKIFGILKILILSSLLMACANTQESALKEMQLSFVTVHHSTLQIPLHASYQWSEGFSHQSVEGRLHHVDMWSLLKQAIEQEMLDKGYQQALPHESADLHISFVAALTSALNDTEIQQQYGLVPGLETGLIDHHRYEKGTLIFDVVNPATQQIAWRTAGQALANLQSIPAEARAARIQLFVKKLLEFLPDAK